MLGLQQTAFWTEDLQSSISVGVLINQASINDYCMNVYKYELKKNWMVISVQILLKTTLNTELTANACVNRINGVVSSTTTIMLWIYVNDYINALRDGNCYVSATIYLTWFLVPFVLNRDMLCLRGYPDRIKTFYFTVTCGKSQSKLPHSRL